MNTKKLISVILFSIMGLSVVCANESTVAIIKNSKTGNVRAIGSELCKIYTHESKGYLETLNDYIWGIKPEEAVAKELMKDADLLRVIFSGEASDDQIINELKEGCFDFLSEKILPQVNNYFFTLVENEDALDCNTPEVLEKLKSQGFNGSYFETCNETQILLHNQLKKDIQPLQFQSKLIVLLGLSDRLESFNATIMYLGKKHGLFVSDEDDEEIEL